MRVILVTGANGGLGQAIARSFLDESLENFVWLGVHKSQEHASRLVDESAGRARMVVLDVTSRVDWERAVQQILQEHQRIDVLVNNAGRHRDGLLGTLAQEAWDEVLSTNLDSVFHACQTVLPPMISQRCGRIINIASLSALLAPAGQTNYAAAKAGVIALTQSLAKEVARIGITVNAICPGYIETEALAGMPAEERKIVTGKVPMRRFGRPEEVASAVRFLACSEAGYITGSVIKVDGGIL
jgi:3-oxoacyl-[acyl-carrier protein] reductase